MAVRRRPTPVTILAVIQLIGATGYLASVGIVAGMELDVLGGLAMLGLQIVDEKTVTGAVLIAILLAMAAVGYTGAFLLFRLHRLGWTIVMLLTGWSLASQIYLYFSRGDLVPLMMLWSVITVLYLNQRQVQVAFGIGEPATGANPDLDERA